MSFKEMADRSHKIWREDDFIPPPQSLSKMKAGTSPVFFGQILTKIHPA